MRVIVTGAGGQLGHDIVEAFASRHEVVGWGWREMDLLDLPTIENALCKADPECIVHCGEYSDVDQAEVERGLCSKINVEATAIIARIASAMGSKLVYISTHHVFDGAKAGEYETDDLPNPVNFYGLTKLEGEKAVAAASKKNFIIRTSWMYGRARTNFIRSILRQGREQGPLRIVNDQIGSPTYTGDLVGLISDMIVTSKFGLYHATDEGFCSRYEFVKEIISMSGMEARVEPISTEQYGAKAARPKNSRLSKSSLEAAGFNRLPDWKNALRRYLIEDAILSTEGLE